MNSARFIKVIVLTISFATNTGVFANQQDLSAIYKLAVEYDAQFSADRFSAQARIEDSKIARSSLLPSIGVSGGYSYAYNKTQYSGGTLSDIDKSYTSQNLGVQMRQPIVRFDSIYQYRRDSLNNDIADIEQKIAEQGLILRVAEIYFRNLKEKENLEVAKARKTAFAENLEKANISFQLGTYTITDKLEAQARYDIANADAIEALNRLSEAQQALRLLVGEQPQLAAINRQLALPKVDPDDLDFWKSQSLKSNLELQRAQLLAEYATRDVSVQRAEYWPKLDLVGSVTHSKGLSFSGDQTRDEAAVSLQLDMPLVSGGGTMARVRKSSALRQKAHQEYVLAERQAELDAQTSYLNVVNGYSMQEALNQALKSSQSAVNATQKGFEVGVRTNLDLLNAQQQYFETKRDYVNSRYDYLYAWLKLKAVAGTLGNEDIAVINKLLVAL